MPRREMKVEKINDFGGTLKRIVRTLKRFHFMIFLIIIFAVGSTIFSIIGPRIMGNATTEIFNGVISKFTGGGGLNYSSLASILFLLGILYITSAIFSYVQQVLMANVGQKYTYILREKIAHKLNRLPMNYYDKNQAGEILSTITNDVDMMNQGIIQTVPQLVTTVTSVIGIIIMMLTINFTMTLIAICIVPISLALMVFIVKKSQKHFENHQKYLAKVNGSVEEMYSGHNVIKAFNVEDKMLDKFSDENEALCTAAWKSNFISGLMHPLMIFLGNIGYVVIAIIGGIFCIKNKITVGNIQSFITYTRNLTNPIGQLAQVFNVIQSSVAAAERIFKFLDEDEEVDTTTTKVDLNKIKGKVEFKHVHFGYNKDKIVINDFNALVNPGQKIAIVGPTGAGKTTIVKLLMRFYSVNSGEILVDGININDYDRSDLRTIFGMVLQDTWMFNGTVMENLKFGRLDASDEDVIKAAKTANVHHFINTLPDGYNMVMNEETSNISQGQKQLLTIARAILANPKILILDEATSSVDTRTEILIQNAMDKLMKGRTSFIIAHRLSTIQNADLILVMDKGDIVEVGTHESLLEKNGFYAKIYNSQFE